MAKVIGGPWHGKQAPSEDPECLSGLQLKSSAPRFAHCGYRRHEFVVSGERAVAYVYEDLTDDNALAYLRTGKLSRDTAPASRE